MGLIRGTPEKPSEDLYSSMAEVPYKVGWPEVLFLFPLISCVNACCLLNLPFLMLQYAQCLKSPPPPWKEGTPTWSSLYLAHGATFASGSVRLSQQHDKSYQTINPRATLGFVGSYVDVSVKLGMWTRADLKTYELACLACEYLSPESSWRFVVLVQDCSVPDGASIVVQHP